MTSETPSSTAFSTAVSRRPHSIRPRYRATRVPGARSGGRSSDTLTVTTGVVLSTRAGQRWPSGSISSTSSPGPRRTTRARWCASASESTTSAPGVRHLADHVAEGVPHGRSSSTLAQPSSTIRRASRRPRPAKTATTPSTSSGRIPEATSRAGPGRGQRRGQQPQHRRGQVGHHRRRRGQGVAADGAPRDAQADAVAAGVVDRRVHRQLVEVDRPHRIEAQPPRGDRQHARSAPGVQQPARRHRQAGQQREAGSRGAVLGGAEGHPGVDLDVQQGRARRLPRRAHQQTPRHLDRPVELEHRPAPRVVLAVGRDARVHAAVGQRAPRGRRDRAPAAGTQKSRMRLARRAGRLHAAAAQDVRGGDERQVGHLRGGRHREPDQLRISGRRA